MLALCSPQGLENVQKNKTWIRKSIYYTFLEKKSASNILPLGPSADKDAAREARDEIAADAEMRSQVVAGRVPDRVFL